MSRAGVSAALAVSFGLLAGASQANMRAAFDPDLTSAATPTAHIARIPYQGGPVLNSNRTHVIFWQPSGSGLSFDPGYTELVTRFLRDIAAASHSTANVFGITGQYTDRRGPATYASHFAGAVLATDPLPANGCSEPTKDGPGWQVCLTDAQLEREITHVIAADHLPPGGNNIYFLLTPSGLGSCQDSSSSACALGGPDSGYCGYHSSTARNVLYAVIPYNAVPGHCQSQNPRPNSSTADPALSTIGHELIETVTDPLGTAWVDSSGEEIADVCLQRFGRALGGTGAGRWNELINGHHYWIQEVFSRVQDHCEPRPQPDSVSIAGGRWPHLRAAAIFKGDARQPGGKIDSYRWSLGHRRIASGRSLMHAFTRTGTYVLQLRITDSAGNWAYATRSIVVRRGR
jgi:PKD domain-containing protein